MNFLSCGGLEIGHILRFEVGEGGGRIVIERRIVNGEAVAEVVAGGVAFALSSDWSPGAGAVSAGGFVFRISLVGMYPG